MSFKEEVDEKAKEYKVEIMKEIGIGPKVKDKFLSLDDNGNANFVLSRPKLTMLKTFIEERVI